MPAWILGSPASSSGAAERPRGDSHCPRAARLGLGSRWGAPRPAGVVQRRLLTSPDSKMYVNVYECMPEWYPASFAMELHRRKLSNYFRILAYLLSKMLGKQSIAILQGSACACLDSGFARELEQRFGETLCRLRPASAARPHSGLVVGWIWARERVRDGTGGAASVRCSCFRTRISRAA